MKSFVLSNLSALSRSYILKLLSKISYGQIRLTVKDQGKVETLFFGKETKDASVPSTSIIINSSNVWTRLSINLDLGFSEAYMVGEIDCDDLVSLASVRPILFIFFWSTADEVAKIYIGNWKIFTTGNVVLQFVPRIQKLLFSPSNDSKQALRNAASHYDTSNAMFQLFLSPDMSYSSPIWEEEREDEALEDAQRRKVHNIIDKARIQKEHHVLDIGGGWAYLAIEAVKKTGCRVTVTTLSIEQQALGKKRVQEAGLSDRIEILLCDYRKTPKPKPDGFDRVISVEMLEHVGEKFMTTFFEEVSGLLNNKYGIMVIQGITVNNQRFHNNRSKVDTFIDRYIFPGGYLPSVRFLIESLDVGSEGTLELESIQSIGPHYAKALRLWRENFLANWEKIKTQYVKERGNISALALEAFRRRWIYYFSYCEAGFRAGILGDHIITAKRMQSLEVRANVPL